MSEYFKSINPDEGSKDRNPELAENYWSRTPESLLPGDITHPYAYCLGVEAGTQNLYINGSVQFDPDAADPDNYYNRLSLMRVYLSTGEDTPPLDGFVVDIRELGPGNIATQIMPGNPDDDTPYAEFQDPLPVLGCVYMDADDNVAFRGDERLLGDAEHLARSVDDEFFVDPSDEQIDALSQSIASGALVIPKHARFDGLEGDEEEPAMPNEEPPRHRRDI